MKKRNKTRQNNLYHYTSTFHLPIIWESGFLKLTDDMLSFDRLRKQKPVCWLTTSSVPVGHGLEGSFVDKTEVRFTLAHKPYYQYWRIWSKKNKIDKNMAEFLNGKGYDSASWWVSEKAISLEDVIKIENLKTGEVYYDRDTALIRKIG